MSLIADAARLSSVSLNESRSYCEQLTKSQARNFYYGLKLLPEPKRSAMFALYAYMRLVDDIADGEDGRGIPQRQEALDGWEESTTAALAMQRPTEGHAIWPAFTDMVNRHGVPARVFRDVIAGQRQDLESPAFNHFSQLREYCYRVAGVVGVASIYVWGFEGGDATEGLAIDRGIAFQLTNILRDLREDSARGRTYLPREELVEAGLCEADLRGDQMNGNGERFSEFMREQIARAQSYYDRSAALDGCISRDSRPTLMAMTHIYHGLLKKIAANPRRVLRQRVSLSSISKLRIAWRAARSR
ncbi:MAG: phytoene/squalene synthase family protein [Planctomycetota bacterium]|nr:phytoene/squalene synthase family protein [Planctomycetota bacterium]